MNALLSRDESLRPLKAAFVSDLLAARDAIDAVEMSGAGEVLRRLAGILDMAMLPAAQRFSEEIAALVAADGADSQAIRQLARRAIHALLDYLDGGLDGPSTRRLLPLLNEMARAHGAPPVGLHDLCSCALPLDLPDPYPQQDPAVQVGREHEAYQRGLLHWFQGSPEGPAVMHGALEGVLRILPASRRALWWVASALVEGLHLSPAIVGPDIKKLCARVEQELRRLRTGAPEGGSPLLSDLLHAIATICPDGPSARGVSAWYGLDRALPEVSRNQASDLEATRRSLHAARDALERFHDGTEAALEAFIHHVEEARRTLCPLEPSVLARLLDAVAERARLPGGEPSDRWLLDLAQALLVADGACKSPTLSEAAAGSLAGFAEALRMTDARAAVGAEVLKRLRHAQQLIDGLAGDAAKPSEIQYLVGSISQCASVLGVLGEVRAEVLCSFSCARIAEIQTSDPISVDQTMPIRFAPNGTTHGSFDPARTRPIRVVGVNQIGMDQTMSMIAEGISALDLYCTALEQGNQGPDRILLAAFEHLGLADPDAPAPQDQPEALIDAGIPEVCEGPSEIDGMLLAVFLEESLVVLRDMEGQIGALRDDPSASEVLAEVRRGFHTLKGSSSMVRLDGLAHVAHALEDTLNVALGRGLAAGPGLLTVIELAQSRFGEWIAVLGRGGRADIDGDELLRLASRIKNGEDIVELVLEAGTPVEGVAQQVPTLEGTGEVVIGDAVMSARLFQTFAGEALAHHQTLARESEHLSTSGPVEIRLDFLRASHTLAGISWTAGLWYIGDLAGALERWLHALTEDPRPLHEASRELMREAIETLGGMIGAVQRQQCPEPEALAHARASIARIDVLCSAVAPGPATARSEPIDSTPVAEERLDTEILAYFVEESAEFLSAIGGGLRAWRDSPSDGEAAQQLLRVLHNFKGSAHTVGAVYLSRLAHDMEDQVEALVEGGEVPAAVFDALDVCYDRLALATEALQPSAAPGADGPGPSAEPIARDSSLAEGGLDQPLGFMPTASGAVENRDPPVRGGAGERQTLLRIRAEVADRLVSQAGEISIARSRIETEMAAFERGLSDLAATTGRVREQLHEIAIQAESQLQSRLSQVRSEGVDFDPLEFDRYTRLQELTRMIAEGIGDVVTLQQGLARTLDQTTTPLAEQRRIDREHHRDLMRLRGAPFSTIAERMHRAVRQAAREAGKPVELSIRGEHVELNRTVLERLIAPLEHVLRNAVVHGIEPLEERRRAGKPDVGAVTLALRPEATEIRLTVHDDGAGVDVSRIREKALSIGLIGPEQALLDEDLMQLIFSHGFSTAEAVTGLSGRGVGMDIVMRELGEVGGRVKVSSKKGKGAYFSFFLPATLGITQALLVRAGNDFFPVPMVLVGQVSAGQAAYDPAGRLRESIDYRGHPYRLYYLPALLGRADVASEGGRSSRVLLLRAGGERVAVLVDEVLGSREIMVKEIGPQVGSVPGVLGATVLADGRGALIINPLEFARRGVRANPAAASDGPASAATPLVLVVDDSLTVRKFTSRLLTRHGFRVATARDGIEALDQIRTVVPDAILLDIEMPRMDGFELTRVLHSDPRTVDIPIIMLSSRTAAKHRQYAVDLGVRAYLGKPYSEHDLLTQIARCTERRVA